MTVEFEHRTRIGAPVEVVLDLSLDIDAHMASMAHSGERAIGGVTSGLIGLGEEVTWRARHFGIPFTMPGAAGEHRRSAASVAGTGYPGRRGYRPCRRARGLRWARGEPDACATRRHTTERR